MKGSNLSAKLGRALQERAKQILHLKKPFSYQELAEKVGLPPSTVYRFLLRACEGEVDPATHWGTVSAILFAAFPDVVEELTGMVLEVSDVVVAEEDLAHLPSRGVFPPPNIPYVKLQRAIPGDLVALQRCDPQCLSPEASKRSLVWVEIFVVAKHRFVDQVPVVVLQPGFDNYVLKKRPAPNDRLIGSVMEKYVLLVEPER